MTCAEQADHSYPEPVCPAPMPSNVSAMSSAAQRASTTATAYHDEKKQAFEALAAQIERIVNPQHNVVALRG